VGNSDSGKEGGKEASRRLKAAVAGDYEGNLAESHATVTAGTADAMHRRHAGQSNGGKKGLGVPCPNRARTGKRPWQSRSRAPSVCSYRKPKNKLSAKPICFDPNCKTTRYCTAAKEFIARRDSGERAAKRARKERESRSFL
jgi:hypothetical protein